MRFSRFFLVLSLFPSLFPFSVFAVTGPTPEELLEQQWDTECRKTFPFGQGDLEPAMIELVRNCVNEKRHAKEIADDRIREILRESDRFAREALRRENVQATRRRGFQDILDRMLARRGDQGGRTLQYIPSSHTFRQHRQTGAPSTSGD